ncbi:formate dehydrogenase accessory sulfurtransferase FdhD [Marinobacter xestospongiae]|uniref:formate dehydrogenase accessory sulfurtransferase FdhD n=1 Tax=Marinobacter xestospongiae TaxID=994319 RepID=UPI0037432E63
MNDADNNKNRVASRSHPGQDGIRTFSYRGCASPDPSRPVPLVEETAVAVSYNGISQAVMMLSPVHLEDFAVGFSLSQGFIDSVDDILDLQVTAAGDGLELAITVTSRAHWGLRQHRRQLAGTTGCGLCGVDSLQQALPELAPLSPQPLPPADRFLTLRDRMAAAQTLGQTSGALHAALFIDAANNPVACREDIGRHNALDKLIGALARQRRPLPGGLAVMTSRCSQELIQKAVRAGLGTLVSFSAPSTLAVDWARRHNLNLVHLSRQGEPRVYSPYALTDDTHTERRP